jgi:hypothetical protein
MADWISVSISRGPIRGAHRNDLGMRMHVKARPELETFMQQLSGGQKCPTNSYSEAWTSQNAKELEVYLIDKPLGAGNYTLEHVCGDPVVQNRVPRTGATEDKINLSFLKLVGISSDEGLTFGISGIFSADVCNRLKLELNGALRQFLTDYVVPVNINLQVVSRDY